MKRFWQRAEVVARAPDFAVLLDGKPVSVPEFGALLLKNARLAHAIAAEWQAAGETFRPDDLPLTRLAATARHRVAPRRADIVAELAKYGGNDLLCYRAEDAALAAREAAAWDPWLTWAAATLNIALQAGAGLAHVPQRAGSLAACAQTLAALSDAELAGLGVIIPALGSLVLGLAVLAGALEPDAACRIAELDALWQEARWGTDREAAAHRLALAADVAVASKFVILCRA